ncbi:30S ribosomal protein S20 [Gammaproteobacteria bacterium]|jgi:small subunit ribosomal protein S20|nr:30S ribosomal protein S20 [Gammaproteobacteria bacterium]|tara:strand:- start:524 stop:787 length:264 start_codon:yes stop_codon:yes gene_type:complete
MANTSSAKKRVKQSERNRERNIALKNRMRTSVKKVLKATDDGNQTEAVESYKIAKPLIDSLARKGIIHKNKAANQKKKLSKRIKALA